ncbi:homogentisate 1,2-dioxygenase [bacterium]|nr:homogentisate 1,2-dioxygenase [bacterium]MDA7905895.1 homogentisate 1,2-dioxygenase [Mariniblastus sp.]MDA7924155.1 homogentisate 1,2-dioxygenase [Mariniblastus sp.]MDB4483696.1 homogentisate 1,2-dioxygenase [bacterium]
MPSYRRLGEIPPKRHMQFENKGESYLNEGLFYEHVVTTQGFDRVYSILYHRRPPTRVVSTETVGKLELNACSDQELRHHHIKSGDLVRGGDPITDRIPMMFNEDLTAYRVRPDRQQAEIYRNAAADEIIFIHHGQGHIETTYGRLPYRRGDYCVIPRTCNYRIVSESISQEDHLIIESNGPVRIPQQYLNQDGQMLLGSPYSERDFHSPLELDSKDEDVETSILIKNGSQLTRVVMANNPFDVVGWDGFLYPYTFNAWDFEPLTGTLHLPPPYQQTFEMRGFVICTFAPRHLDHHPKAVKVPYVHSNVEADEVLYYVEGEFGSRKGVDVGSMTLHPGGIPHGPHPGTIMKSMGMDFTNEMAVMYDTDRPLFLTQQAMEMDDPSYPVSWL